MTPDLDALTALRAAATPGEVLPFADQEHCASDCCDWYPRLHVHGDPAEYQRLVPSLIEAARREAAIRHWWETTHATELDRHDHHCPAERFRGPPPGHFENTGEPCTCGWTEASAALHDNAGTPVATPGAGE